MAKTKYEVDATQAVRGFKKVADELKKFDKVVDENAASLKKATKEAASLAKQADPQKRYNAQMEKLARAVKSGGLSLKDAAVQAAKYKRQLEGATRAGKGAFGGQAFASVSRFATGVLSIGTALSVVRSEIEQTKQAADRVSQSQTTAAGARRQLKLNVATATPEIQKLAVDSADSIARDLHLDSIIVDNAVGSAISASPDPKRAVAFARGVLDAIRDTPGAGEISGGVLDIGNALKTDDVNLAFGFLGRNQRLTRATDVRQITKNLPKVLAVGAAEGLSPDKSSAVFNALSVGGADKDLRISRTGTINLFSKTKDFFADLVKQGEFTNEQTDELGERLDLLLASPKLSKQFIDKVGFDGAAIAGISNLLLDPESEARKTYKLTLSDLADTEVVRAAGKDAIAFLNNGDQAAPGRAISSTTQQLNLGKAISLSTEKQTEINDIVQDLYVKAGRRQLRTITEFSRLYRSDLDGTYTPEEAANFLEVQLRSVASESSEVRVNSDDFREASASTRALIEELRSSGSGPSPQQE